MKALRKMLGPRCRSEDVEEKMSQDGGVTCGSQWQRQVSAEDVKEDVKGRFRTEMSKGRCRRLEGSPIEC